MRKYKHLFIILTFSTACLGVSVYAYLTAEDAIEFQFAGLDSQNVDDALQDQSFFTRGNFFQVEDNRPRVSINFDELVVNQASQTSLFLRPQGEAYTDTLDVLEYRALRGHLNEQTNLLNLLDDVNLKFEHSDLQADEVVYDMGRDLIEAKGSVKTQRK